VFGDDSPEGDLVGLGSKHADLRRLALVRLFQRKLLADTKVQAIVRWREEDADAVVRQTAFLLTLYTRPKLVDTLRKRDPELHRQLTELETFGKEPAPQAEAKPQPEGAVAKRAKREADGKVDLAEGDYDPLLQATASRALDTCLRGARGLAVLHDTRAFGLLLQLSREENPPARVEVCHAMAALDDPRAVSRLRALLYDGEASVRDAAFTALARIDTERPLGVAES